MLLYKQAAGEKKNGRIVTEHSFSPQVQHSMSGMEEEVHGSGGSPTPQTAVEVISPRGDSYSSIIDLYGSNTEYEFVPDDQVVATTVEVGCSKMEDCDFEEFPSESFKMRKLAEKCLKQARDRIVKKYNRIRSNNMHIKFMHAAEAAIITREEKHDELQESAPLLNSTANGSSLTATGGESEQATRSRTVNGSDSRKRECYVGDFTAETLSSPSRAAKCLRIARGSIIKKNKKVRFLQQRERRLKLKFDELEKEMSKWKESRRIADDALTILLLEGEEEQRKGAVHTTADCPSTASMKPFDAEQTTDNIPWSSLPMGEEKGLEPRSGAEIFHMAHSLLMQSRGAKARDIHEIDSILSLMSYWTQLTPEVQKYGFNRLYLLHTALKKGWSNTLRIYDKQCNESPQS